MSDEPGPYLIRHGDVWFAQPRSKSVEAVLGRDDRHVCGPHEMLAVAYDAEDGTLHRHGPDALVSAWANQTRGKLSRNGFDEQAEALTVLAFLPLQEAVDELNACIASTGRVLGLPERLAEIAERNPEALPPAWPAH